MEQNENTGMLNKDQMLRARFVEREPTIGFIARGFAGAEERKHEPMEDFLRDNIAGHKRNAEKQIQENEAEAQRRLKGEIRRTEEKIDRLEMLEEITENIRYT